MALRTISVPKIRQPTLKTGDKYANEKWFFINGVLVDSGWLDENCKYLEKRFDRSVTGIHNESFGILWDFVETIFMRSFDINVMQVHFATQNILPALKNETIDIVRLIAHSEVAMIGVLSNINNDHFQGEIFVNETRNEGKGHMLNTFYSLSAGDYKSWRSNDSLPTLLNLPG
ncbi:6641_t:CDS:2, partial [Racocetra fulgida]